MIFAKTFSSTIFSLYNACLPTFMVINYGTGLGLAGCSVTAFLASMIFSRFVAARFTELIGRKRMLVYSSLLATVISFGYFLELGIVGFLVLRFIHGFAFGIANNTLNVITTDYIPKERLGEGFGFYSLGTTVATAFGPFVGITLLRTGDSFVMFAICTISAIISLLFSLPLTSVKHDFEPDDKAVTKKRSAFLEKYLEFSAIPVALTITMVTICYASVISLINLFADERGFGASSLFFIVYAVVLFAARPASGRLFDRRGEGAVAIPSLVCLVIAFVILASSHSDIELLISAVLFSLGYGCVMSCGQTSVIKDARPERVPMATSTYYALTDFGLGFGPAIMGLLVAPIGYTGVFFIGAGVSVLAIPAYIAILSRKKHAG